ncbi:MAG: hypothetical protein WA086_12100, partial [Ideonella sp.]
MNPTGLLLATFILSVAGLFAFIWSLRKGLFDADPAAARVIFIDGEIGQRDAALALPSASLPLAADQAEVAARERADRSSALPSFVLIASAVVWLVLASIAGLLSSYKLHHPDFLSDYAWLTFGRLRTMHLNGVAYGWAPLGLL